MVHMERALPPDGGDTGRLPGRTKPWVKSEERGVNRGRGVPGNHTQRHKGIRRAGLWCVWSNRRALDKQAGKPCVRWERPEQKAMQSTCRVLQKWHRSLCLLERKNDIMNNGWTRWTNNRETSLEVRESKTTNGSYNHGTRKIMESELFGARRKSFTWSH